MEGKGCVPMLIKVDRLEYLLAQLFHCHGLSEEDSVIASKCLITAEMAGITTHGIEMVPAHIQKCDYGYNTKAKLKITKTTEAFTLCDADNAVGMVSAWKCIQLAVEKAEQSGMHAVFCHNANTFSAAYCYAKYAVEHGKIAIVMCNSPAQMAPLGGCEKMLGTNPLAIGVPADRGKPFILDMATSAVAKSKINQALHNGQEKIPFGWATDQYGKPTDNPKEAVAGLILPMAGAKGYGLAMAIDILSGILTKAAYLDGVGRFYSPDNRCMNVGHTFIVLDPKQIYGSDFYADMDAYLDRVRTSKGVDGQQVLVPGDLNVNRCEKCILEGIEVKQNVVEKLNPLLQEIGKSI